MTIRPTLKEQAKSYRSMHRVIELIESGKIRGFNQEILEYMKEISLYEYTYKVKKKSKNKRVPHYEYH